MSDQQKTLCCNEAGDSVSLEQFMQMKPGIYIGTTPNGKRAVIKVSDKEPVVNMQVVLERGHVREIQFYSDYTIHEEEKQIHI